MDLRDDTSPGAASGLYANHPSLFLQWLRHDARVPDQTSDLRLQRWIGEGMQMNALLFLAIATLLLFIYLWRKEMAKTAELTAAVDAAVAKINELRTSSTPDADVQAQIDRLNAAVNPPAPQP